jgi:DNA polymerase-3 subunit epsilon
VSLLRRTADERRVRALRSVDPGPLRDYLAVPFPGADTPLDELALLAVDIETTGLDPQADRVLSIGWVPVDGRAVRLSGARRVVVAHGEAVGQSATVHGLTDDVLAGGVALAEAVALLLRDLAGRVLLAHFARIETRFLSTACERLWGGRMPCEVVDTFVLEQRALAGSAGGGRWGREPEPGALRLWAARKRRGLPVYPAHEALVDALACAELYLAQRAELEARSAGSSLALRHVRV